jgi:hypothetical protein
MIQPLAVFINQRKDTVSRTGRMPLQANLLAEPAADGGMVSVSASPSALNIVSSFIHVSLSKKTSSYIGVRQVFRQYNYFTVPAHLDGDVMASTF